MDSFSISDLERFSGIKAHTIRAWEQRYDALKPNRSSGNTRSYNSLQLRRLLNIASLMDTGYKISELGTMTDEDLFRLIDSRIEPGTGKIPEAKYYTDQLIAAALTYDEARFDTIFSNAILRYGLPDTYTDVLYPLLNRLGLMWTKEELRPANEHFITNLIRRKILAATDALPPARINTTWLLFLPENEFHETGLLMASYLIRSAGQRVIYLGTNVNPDSLVSAALELAPDRFLQFLVRNNDPELELRSLRNMEKLFPDRSIYVACSRKRGKLLDEKGNWMVLNSVEDLLSELKTV